LIEQLQSDALDVPNVCVVGPPGSERTHHAREICLATGAVHVSLDAVLNDEAELGSNAGQSIKEYDPKSKVSWAS
jgi:adenylate kinase family enzyme